MKQISIIISVVCFSISAHAQFKLGGGMIQLGQVPTTNTNYSVFVERYDGFRWTGTSMLNITLNEARPAISSNNRSIYFYNTDNGTYNNVGVKTTFAFMYDNNSASGSVVSNSLGKVIGLDAAVMKTKVQEDLRQPAEMVADNSKQYGLTKESIRRTIPELTVTDEFGNQMVDANSIVPLLVGAVKSLKQQADLQAEQIKALASSQTRRMQSRDMELTDIKTMEDASELYPSDPNPFRNRITISYRIKSSAKEARLRVNDGNGKIFVNITLSDRGKGKVRIDGTRWSAGIYFCSLIVDGEIVNTYKIVKK